MDVEWSSTDHDDVLLTFKVTGADAVVIPDWAVPERADDLWRTTCFEMFWRAKPSDSYVEFNLSPAGRWAAYAFDDYRSGMRHHPMALDPHIETEAVASCLVTEIDVDFSTLPGGAAYVGLAAVIEETNGTKSYWALAHPDGPPDFHDPACFTLEVPAPR